MTYPEYVSSDPIAVDATLNCLGILIRSRQNIATRILNAILNFNPFEQANLISPLTIKAKLQMKSMERTTRTVLLNVLRRCVSSKHLMNAIGLTEPTGTIVVHSPAESSNTSTV